MINSHSRGVRPLEPLLESVRNLAAWRSRTFLGLLLAVLGGGLAGGLLSASASAFSRDVLDEDFHGPQVVQIGDASQPNGPTMSRASCEGLVALAGVRSAGTYQVVGYETFRSLGTVAIAQASTSLVDFGHASLVIGEELASEAGVPPTGFVHTADAEPLALDFQVGARQPSGIDLNGSVAVPVTPTSEARTCLVWLRSNVNAADALPLLVASLDVRGEGLIVKVSPDSGQAAHRYLTRPDRVLTLAIGGLVGLVVGLLRRFRPADAVSYRMSGFGRGAVALLFLVEDVTAASAFLSAALGVIAVRCDLTLVVANILWASAGSLSLIAAASLVTLAVLLPNPAGLARS